MATKQKEKASSQRVEAASQSGPEELQSPPRPDGLKKLLYWIIFIAVGVFSVFYNTNGWSTQMFNISRALDATVKSVMLIVLAGGVNKIVAFAFVHIGTSTNRGKTVNRLLASMVKYGIAIAVIVMSLTYFIEDTSSLFTGLSMLTLVVGLGAQTLISDIVAGIFIVFEGSYQVGDVVVIDGWRGTVNEIGIRTTKIEDAGGNIEIINNASISKIINNSASLSVAICSVGIEYGESLERVENIIKDNLEYMRIRIPDIVDGPYYKGVDLLADSSVVLKFIAKATEDNKFQVQRDLNREIKLLFDKHSIGIPFPQITVSHLVENNEKELTMRERYTAEQFVDSQKELSKGIEETNT